MLLACSYREISDSEFEAILAGDMDAPAFLESANKEAEQ